MMAAPQIRPADSPSPWPSQIVVRASSLHSSTAESFNHDGRTTNLLPPIPFPSRLGQIVVRASSLHGSTIRPTEIFNFQFSICNL